MRYLLLFLILFTVLTQTATGQANTKADFKRFSFTGGGNFSHINFARGVPPVPITTSWATGLHVGFAMLVPITGKLFFQPEYLYSQMGGMEKEKDTAYSLNYLSLPLFLRYEVHEKFALLAGPQFDLLINAKKKLKSNFTDITHDTEERSLALTGGIEYQPVASFSIFAKYMYGLNHIGIGQRSSLQEFKYEMFQLSACVKF